MFTRATIIAITLTGNGWIAADAHELDPDNPVHTICGLYESVYGQVAEARLQGMRYTDMQGAIRAMNPGVGRGLFISAVDEVWDIRWDREELTVQKFVAEVHARECHDAESD